MSTTPSPDQLLAEAERAVGDRYRIESLAGEGGMGRVFAARDTQLGRRVAIKLLTVLDPNPDEDPGLRAHDRLVGEARAMARLNHPNLCRVIEVSLVGQTPFLVMDWVDGADLTRFCKPFETKHRISILLRVVDAVAAMHQAGLVHGDLKPSNVLVDHDERPTIVDFGLARAESDPSWIATPRGGTPGYSAPELMTAHAEIDPSVDVFSLGVMLYELLTDRTPFPKRTAPAVVIDLLRRGAVPLPEHYSPGVPADLQKICLAAMEPEPGDRYPDAAAMAADLRRYLRRETVSARPRLLESKFDEQIEQQILQTREWRRLGLITPRETEVVTRVLADLQRAESPWIIDARRLQASQVSLYLGGWILALGLVVGLADTWDVIGAPLGIATAWLFALLSLGLGYRLQSAGEKRIGVGMLVTGQVALPAAVWLVLRHTAWLAGADGTGMGPASELTAMLFRGERPLPGLANAQILALSLVGLGLAGSLRAVVRSSAFTFFSVLGAGAGWLSLYLVFGGLDAMPSVALGRWGLWLALLGVATLPAGLIVDAREHEIIREIGRRRAKQRDAAPVLCGSLLWMGLGITAAALFAPAWYLFEHADENPMNPAKQAWAFAINGLILVGVMVVLGRRPTPLRRRIAEVLRWVLPTHLMAPLLFMEIHETWGVWLPWLVLLPVLAIGFCFASALRQWKPFLISGLAYLAIWYGRCFVRIEADLPEATAWRVVLTFAAVLLGPALMVLAWRAPAWIARRRLERWERRSALRAGPRAGQSWR
ncbi:MAG: serine/threonine protein kinase [Phycisphaeraceae bacterium]|nr:MAG: serine/threonine protein kinase [Phycisphaeraceae bacterium]